MEGKQQKTKDYELQISKSDFWNDQKEAVKITKEAEDLRKELAEWEEITKELNDLEQLAELAKKETDEVLNKEIENKLAELETLYKKMEFFVLFAGSYDESSAIISIHAGTGGVDAQDWAEMLERMYLRFAEKQGWQVEILDRNQGNEAGIKSDLIRISGRWVYGYLRSEAGVHRLVRISPFDAEAMRQTSFALVEVIPELPEAEGIEIKDEDLEYNFSRSSGPGGQNVNKTNTAVRITHKPTGITIAAQTERSQSQNRERAMAILKAKLFAMAAAEQMAEIKGIKGKTQKAEWGKQIRSYVLEPYQLVKDHRTNHETSDVDAVLDGELLPFIEAYLRHGLKS